MRYLIMCSLLLMIGCNNKKNTEIPTGGPFIDQEQKNTKGEEKLVSTEVKVPFLNIIEGSVYEILKVDATRETSQTLRTVMDWSHIYKVAIEKNKLTQSRDDLLTFIPNTWDLPSLHMIDKVLDDYKLRKLGNQLKHYNDQFLKINYYLHFDIADGFEFDQLQSIEIEFIQGAKQVIAKNKLKLDGNIVLDENGKLMLGGHVNIHNMDDVDFSQLKKMPLKVKIKDAHFKIDNKVVSLREELERKLETHDFLYFNNLNEESYRFVKKNIELGDIFKAGDWNFVYNERDELRIVDGLSIYEDDTYGKERRANWKENLITEDEIKYIVYEKLKRAKVIEGKNHFSGKDIEFKHNLFLYNVMKYVHTRSSSYTIDHRYSACTKKKLYNDKGKDFVDICQEKLCSVLKEDSLGSLKEAVEAQDFKRLIYLYVDGKKTQAFRVEPTFRGFNLIISKEIEGEVIQFSYTPEEDNSYGVINTNCPASENIGGRKFTDKREISFDFLAY